MRCSPPGVLAKIALSVYAGRQRTVRKGFGARHTIVIGGWAIAFILTTWLGTTTFHENVLFAVVAAAACALPFALGAWSEIRRPA